MSALPNLSDASNQVFDDVIRRAVYGADPVVVVQSPPGAGKTFLVECAAVVAATDRRFRVGIVTPGVSQAYDVADRLRAYDLPRLELVHAAHRDLPARLVGRLAATRGWNAALNTGAGVLVTNVHMPAAYLDRLPAGTFDLLIVDEAYQLAANQFMKVSDLAPRILMVGDPGQLPPVVSTDTSNLEAAAHKVHWSAPAYVMDRWPATPVFGLPATRRLLPDTAEVVQQSFYPKLPFRSVAVPAQRRVRFAIAGADPSIDPALDAIAAGASIVGIVVPGCPPAHEETDPEVTAVIARIAGRLLLRQAEWAGERRLVPADIGCIDPHRNSVGAISSRLRHVGLTDTVVDTVERWQGLQVPISIVRHPLSRPGKPQAFDLQAGRWCVALSRHQLGCVVVARESVADEIRDYVHTCDTAAAGASDPVWAGFAAHRSIWSLLESQVRLFRA